MEQLTKNQAVATSQEAVQNQNEPQLRDENAHNDKSVHGVLNPTYQAGLRRDAVQPDIEAERKKRDEIPNHETNINIIARRTGKDVNSHTVLDGIITTIMATIQRINIIGSREGSRNRRRLKANQTGKKFRVGIK